MSTLTIPTPSLSILCFDRIVAQAFFSNPLVSFFLLGVCDVDLLLLSRVTGSGSLRHKGNDTLAIRETPRGNFMQNTQKLNVT